MFNHAKSRGYLQKNQLDPESQPPKSLLADPLPETKCSTWFLARRGFTRVVLMRAIAFRMKIKIRGSAKTIA